MCRHRPATHERLDLRSVVCLSCVVDLAGTLARRPEIADELRAGIVDFDAHRDERLAERSPVRWAHELTAQVLLVRGARDWRVDDEQTRTFARAHGSVLEVDDGHELIARRDEILPAIDRTLACGFAGGCGALVPTRRWSDGLVYARAPSGSFEMGCVPATHGATSWSSRGIA